MYSLKDGVDVINCDDYITVELPTIDLLWQSIFRPIEMVITAGCEGHKGDGVHMETSLHYAENSPTKKGRAVDIRTKDVDIEKVKQVFVPCLKLILNYPTHSFDVVLESHTVGVNTVTHVHCEYQPA